jgi:hypothetical protein
MADESQVCERKSDSSMEMSRDKRKLQQNPFTTYRDPRTGQWVVIKSVA